MKNYHFFSILLSSAAALLITMETSNAASMVNISAEASGWVQPNGIDTNGNQAYTTNFIAGTADVDNGLPFRNFFVFDLGGVQDSVVSATLRLQNPDDGFYSLENDYFNRSDFYTYSITGFFGSELDSSRLLSENWTSYTTALIASYVIGSGDSFGDVQVNESSNGTIVDITFNAVGLDNLNSFLQAGLTDPYYALGGKLTQPNARWVHIFANSGGGQFSRELLLEIAVPVPSAIWLLGGALGILMFKSKRRRPM